MPKPEVEKTEGNAEGATEKKCCSLLKNKTALIGIAAAAALVLLLVIVISAIANSGNGFIERECAYQITQNEDGDLVVLNGDKLLKDKIDVENAAIVSWSASESIDGKVVAVLVQDMDGADATSTLYVITKNKIKEVAKDVSYYTLSVNGDVIVYTEVDEENEKTTLVSYTVKNGKSKDIVKSDEESSVAEYILSPDGKTVVYTVGKSDDEGDGDMTYTTYLFSGKKSEKIISSEIDLVAVANKAKYIYALAEEEKEDGTVNNLYVYNKKGEKETKLGKVAIGYVQFNADCTQAIYYTTNDKGDVYSYLSINGKEGVKLAKAALVLTTGGVDTTSFLRKGNAVVYPVEDLYDHVYTGSNSKIGTDAYLVKKGEDKTVKLVSGIMDTYILDKSAEYLYYQEIDDSDGALKVIKIAKGENAKDKAKTIAEDVDRYVVTSDRKSVYYVDGDALYKVNGKKGGKTKTIASDEVVADSLIISDKDVVYYTDADDTLYLTTGGKGKKVMDDCADIGVVNGEVFVENTDNEISYINKTKKPKKLVTKYVKKAEAPDYGDEGIG